MCDLSLLTDAGPELAVPATKTVTAQMLVVAAIAAAFDSALVYDPDAPEGLSKVTATH